MLLPINAARNRDKIGGRGRRKGKELEHRLKKDEEVNRVGVQTPDIKGRVAERFRNKGL